MAGMPLGPGGLPLDIKPPYTGQWDTELTRTFLAKHKNCMISVQKEVSDYLVGENISSLDMFNMVRGECVQEMARYMFEKQKVEILSYKNPMRDRTEILARSYVFSKEELQYLIIDIFKTAKEAVKQEQCTVKAVQTKDVQATNYDAFMENLRNEAL